MALRKRSSSLTSFLGKKKDASSSECSPGDGEEDTSSMLDEKKKKKKSKKDKSSSRSDCREPSPTAEQQEIAQLKKEMAVLHQKLDSVVTLINNETMDVPKERPLCECVLI